jgi:hypothetical protein
MRAKPQPGFFSEASSRQTASGLSPRLRIPRLADSRSAFSLSAVCSSTRPTALRVEIPPLAPGAAREYPLGRGEEPPW